MKTNVKDLGRSHGQPLQVYLDSSDYSVLGDALANPSHQHAGTLAGLAEMVDSGKIEIRYSGIHVVEVSHIEKSARDAGVRRAKCIERLCKGKCFIYWTSMLAQEQENFEQGNRLYTGLTSEDSSWFPDISDVAKSFSASIKEGILEVINGSGKNRRERRIAEKLLLKNGKLSSFAAAKLQGPGRAALLNGLAEQFPLSDRFYKDDLIIDFATGKMSAADLVWEMSIVFRDVERFIGWTYDTRDIDRKTNKWFRDLGDTLKTNVERLRNMFESLVALVPPEKIKGTLDTIIDERLPEMRRNFITKMADKPQNALIGELGDLPALDTFVRAIGVYVKMSVRGNRNLLPSDSGDLFHLSHAPYCDVFRADGNTSQIANQVLKPYGTEVVPKLAQLVDTLDTMLKARR